MKSIFAGGLLFFLVAATRAVSVPDTILLNASDTPYWVSASVAVDAEGNLRRDLFTNSVRESILRMARDRERRYPTTRPADPCVATIIAGHRTSVGTLRSWDSVRDATVAAYRGRITAVVQGFERGVPASLLRIDDVRVIKANDAFPAAGPLYATYPSADFMIGTQRVCNRTHDPSYVPSVGDRVLLTAHDVPRDTGRRFLVLEEEQMLFEREGRLIVPHRLRNEPALRGRKLIDLERDIAVVNRRAKER